MPLMHGVTIGVNVCGYHFNSHIMEGAINQDRIRELTIYWYLDVERFPTEKT